MTPDPLSELPPALARVECSGERHTIRWASGNLVALDHVDPEGERTLAALGGTGCACLDVLGAWSRQQENPGLLTALSRGTQDQIQAEGFQTRTFVPYPATTTPRNVLRPARGGGMTHGWVAVTGSAVRMTGGAVPAGVMDPRTNAGPTREDDLALLAGLGHELTLRLVATVTATLLDRLDGPDRFSARPVLEASLFGRASCALRSWLATPDLEVELQMTRPDEEPSLEWDGGGPVQVALPPEWVTTVWGRDLTVIAGRFSLAVVDSTASRTTLVTIGSDLGTPRRLVVEVL
jgi:hypothetical protein